MRSLLRGDGRWDLAYHCRATTRPQRGLGVGVEGRSTLGLLLLLLVLDEQGGGELCGLRGLRGARGLHRGGCVGIGDSSAAVVCHVLV
eukprot:1161680-Pelagomonas_calceolata.AAC.7